MKQILLLLFSGTFCFCGQEKIVYGFKKDEENRDVITINRYQFSEKQEVKNTNFVNFSPDGSINPAYNRNSCGVQCYTTSDNWSQIIQPVEWSAIKSPFRHIVRSRPIPYLELIDVVAECHTEYAKLPYEAQESMVRYFFDGPNAANEIDMQEAYIAMVIMKNGSNGTFLMHRYNCQSYKIMSTYSPDIVTPLMRNGILSLALNNPYATVEKKHKLAIVTSCDARMCKVISYALNGSDMKLLKEQIFNEKFIKIAWLFRDHLLALNDQGELKTVTSSQDKLVAYKQTFGKHKIKDFAVDMAHPRQFVVLTESPQHIFFATFGQLQKISCDIEHEQSEKILKVYFNNDTIAWLSENPVKTDREISLHYKTLDRQKCMVSQRAPDRLIWDERSYHTIDPLEKSSLLHKDYNSK